jgi:hypothetical protein
MIESFPGKRMDEEQNRMPGKVTPFMTECFFAFGLNFA